MQISRALSVGLLPVLCLALQVLGTLAFLNPSLCFLHSTRPLLRLHSGVWKVILPKKAVADVDVISVTSLLSEATALCRAVQFLQTVVLYVLFAKGEGGGNPLGQAVQT